MLVHIPVPLFSCCGPRPFLSGVLLKNVRKQIFRGQSSTQGAVWKGLLISSPISFFEPFPNISVLNVNICCIDLGALIEDFRCQPPVTVIFLASFFCLKIFEERQLAKSCRAKLMFIQTILDEDLIVIDFPNKHLYSSFKTLNV